MENAISWKLDRIFGVRIALGLVLTLAPLAGCSDGAGSGFKATSRPEADGPIADIAPYRCWYFPEQGIRRITGLMVPLQENREGAWPSHGGCALRNGYDRIGVDWQQFDGDRILRVAHENFDNTRLASLPADLGRGLIAYTGAPPARMPYYSILLFRCGVKMPWIKVELSQVAKGRNVVADITMLLRVAQRRYGELHKCAPRSR
jgi:hypothetical protein